jgi:hypothetical protein
LDGAEQRFAVAWLVQKGHSTGAQRLAAGFVIAMGREDDDRNGMPGAHQLLLEFQAPKRDIRRSRIRHRVVCRECDCRNSSADAKTATRNPTDRRRPSTASRTDSSSSTTETTSRSPITAFTVPGGWQTD